MDRHGEEGTTTTRNATKPLRVFATPPGEAFTLHVEGYNYQVQTHEELTVVRFIPV